MYISVVFFLIHLTLLEKNILIKPTYLPYFPWVGERKHTIYFFRPAYTCTPVQILRVTLFTNCYTESQNIKVFKNIKQTINLPESKFSNSPIILIFYEDAVTYYVL